MSAALATRRAHLLAERDLIDAAGGGALWLLGGPMSSAPEAAPTEPPLCIVALPAPSFVLHTNDASMSLPHARGHAAASGTVSWARFVNGAGQAVRDCTAGPPGSGAQVLVSDGAATPSARVFVGGEVNVSATFVWP